MSEEEESDEDYVDRDSGPYCQHWAEVGDCEETCATCGHSCAAHWDGDECQRDGCTCAIFVTKPEPKYEPPPPPPPRSYAEQRAEARCFRCGEGFTPDETVITASNDERHDGVDGRMYFTAGVTTWCHERCVRPPC
jgi:hypothetical protein